MSYDLSVVLLIPAVHRDAINTLAEAMGWGPGNLRRELIHSDGSTWYGCHTWAAPAFMDEFANAPAEFAGPLSALVMSVIEGGNPIEHWNSTLSLHGISVAALE